MLRRSLRNGLLGALLFIIMGMFQACSSQDATGPVAKGANDTCVWINGMLFCD